MSTSKLPVAFLVLAVCLGGHFRPAHAQSLDDLELRKRRKQQRLGFGMLALMEQSVGLNRDRPEGNTLLYLAPQLKIGDKMRLRLNTLFVAAWLDRQEDPWDFPDASLQFSHLGFYKIPLADVLLSGHLRYYFPISKASREASSFGQLRLTTKASRALFGRLYLAFEFNMQKYFSRYTTWDTDEDQGSDSWYATAGREDYMINNSSYGFGETFTATVTAVPGLDFSAIFSLYQNRQYQPDETKGDLYGSSYLDEPRDTAWIHTFRLVLDATFGVGSLPWVKKMTGVGQSMLSRTYVSLGYANFAPQLDSRQRNVNPFNPKYASAYLDLMVVY